MVSNLKLHHYVLSCLSFVGVCMPLYATNPGMSPINLRSQSVGQLFRFDPVPQGTDYLDPGQARFRAVHTVANQWGFERRYIMDGQTQDDLVTLDYGLLPNWQLTLGIGAKRVNPSYTDQVTISFHDAFGIPQNWRTDVPINQTRMAIPDYGVEITERDHGRPMTEHGFVHVKRRLLQNEHWLAGFGLFAANEFGSSSLAGQGTRSYGGQFHLSRRLGQFGLLSTWSWVKHEMATEQLFWLRRSSWSWLGALKRGFGNWEVQAQTLIQQGPMPDMGQFSQSTYEIHLGLRRQWQNLSFELTLIENVIWHYNTPDWGFALGLAYQWSQGESVVY